MRIPSRCPRIVSGGRHGEVRIWNKWRDGLNISEGGGEVSADDVNARALFLHDRVTAVGQVRLDRAVVITTDGMGTVVMADFWAEEGNKCGCKRN